MYNFYISTPINARVETDFNDKLAGALERVMDIKELIYKTFPKNQVMDISTFDINPIGLMTEEEAMARCIHAVLKCDAIILDKDWEKSKGCRLEATAAKLYGKRVLKYNELDYPKEYLRQILQIDGSTANPQ